MLVLDTAAGSPAERLYARCSGQRVGVIPAYVLWPDGCLCDRTAYSKTLS